MIRRRIGITVVLGMMGLAAGILVGGRKASAATIEDLKNKFPNGAYWNHVVQSGHGYSNYQDYGSCNNPDGYTWSPCDTHNGNVGVGGHDCNSFQNAMQCCGFAKKLAYDLYGSTHTSWGTTTLANAKIGDVVHYKGAGADATFGHWVMIIGKNGNTLTFGECNVGSNCKIIWGRSLDMSRASSYTIYSAPWEATLSSIPSASVSYSNIAVEFADNWNAGLYGRIENPNRSVISGVGVHVWDSEGKLVVDHTESCGLSTSYVEQRFNIVAEALPGGLRSGETYTFEMFAGVNGTNVISPKGSFTCTDAEKPVITDIKVEDVGPDGYTVSCKATDNFKIDRVQFPTWTLGGEQEQDDLPGDWGTNPLCSGMKDGNTYTFRVKRSEHNNEFGTYRTHIYAWDKAGNYTAVAIDDVTVKKAEESKPMQKPQETDGASATSGTEGTSGLKETSGISETQVASGIGTPSVIVPAVRGLSVKNKKERKIKCTWKKIKGAFYYTVEMASNRSFTKGRKRVRVYGTKYTRYSMKKKKTYYVRVCVWKYVPERGYVAGKWSAVKKVKIKK